MTEVYTSVKKLNFYKQKKIKSLSHTEITVRIGLKTQLEWGHAIYRIGYPLLVGIVFNSPLLSPSKTSKINPDWRSDPCPQIMGNRTKHARGPAHYLPSVTYVVSVEFFPLNSIILI